VLDYKIYIYCLNYCSLYSISSLIFIRETEWKKRQSP